MNGNQLEQLIGFMKDITQKLRTSSSVVSETEFYLTKIKQPHITPLLLQILHLSNPQVLPPGEDQYVKQTAAIFLRQILTKYYPEEQYYTPDQRMEIRRLLFQAFFQSPPHLYKLLLESFSIVASVDFPARWPDMLQLIKQTYISGNYETQLTCVILMTRIVKHYRSGLTEHTVQELKELVLILPTLLPKFYEVPVTDPMMMAFLKLIHGIVSIELVDEIEENIEPICRKLHLSVAGGPSKVTLYIFKIYNLFVTRFLDCEFLEKQMAQTIFMTSIQYLSLQERDENISTVAFDNISAMSKFIKEFNNDQMTQLARIISRDIALSEKETVMMREDPVEFVKHELESDLFSVRKSAGNTLNMMRIARPDTYSFIVEISRTIMKTDIETGIRLFIGLVVEGEIPRYGATRVSNVQDITVFYMNDVKPHFFAGPNFSTLKYIHKFRSILKVGPEEYQQIYIRLTQYALNPMIMKEHPAFSMFSAKTIEDMLLLRSSPNYMRTENCIPDEQLQNGYQMAVELIKIGLQFGSIYHLRSAIRILQRCKKNPAFLQPNEFFEQIPHVIIPSLQTDITSKTLDGTFVSLKFEILASLLNIRLIDIGPQLIEITKASVQAQNYDTLAYSVQLVSLYLPSSASFLKPILQIDIRGNTALLKPFVKYIVACAVKAPQSFDNEVIGKIIELFQYAVEIDFFEDAFAMVGAIANNLDIGQLSQLPNFVQFSVQKYYSHKTKSFSTEIIRFILHACYRLDTQMISQLQIPLPFISMITSDFLYLPAGESRLVCAIGLLKLLSIQQYLHQFLNEMNPSQLVNCIHQVLSVKRMVSMIDEVPNSDTSMDLANVKLVSYERRSENILMELKEKFHALFTMQVMKDGQTFVLNQTLDQNAVKLSQMIMNWQ